MLLLFIMPVLPGHRYIGPGNPLDNGEPVDEDDWVAYLHDLEYSLAQSDQDIQDSDKRAISSFLRIGNWESILGAAGLSAKWLTEKVFGVQYPSMPKAKDKTRKHPRDQLADLVQESKRRGTPDHIPPLPQESVGDEYLDSAIGYGDEEPEGPLTPPQSVFNMDTSNTLRTAPMSAPGTSGGGGGQGPGPVAMNGGGLIPFLGTHSNTIGDQTIKHSVSFFTMGYAFTPNVDYTGSSILIAGNPSILATPISSFPVHDLRAFITQQEYLTLPFGAHVKEIKVDIYPKGVALPFATNQTESGYANSHIFCKTVHGIGLNNKFNMVDRLSYSSEPTKSMVPTGYNAGDAPNDIFWPNANSAVGSMQLAQRHLKMYTGFFGELLQTYNIAEHTTTNVFESPSAAPMVSYSYKPTVNYCKTLRSEIPVLMNTNSVAVGGIPTGGKMNNFGFTVMCNAARTAVPHLSRFDTVPTIKSNLYDDRMNRYDQPIEQKDFISPHLFKDLSGNAQPGLYFGILPTQNNTVTAASPTFGDISMNWVANTSITFGFNLGDSMTSNIYQHLQNELYYFTKIAQWNNTEPNFWQCGYNVSMLALNTQTVYNESVLVPTRLNKYDPPATRSGTIYNTTSNEEPDDTETAKAKAKRKMKNVMFNTE